METAELDSLKKKKEIVEKKKDNITCRVLAESITSWQDAQLHIWKDGDPLPSRNRSKVSTNMHVEQDLLG
jgi:hypothetical protein